MFAFILASNIVQYLFVTVKIFGIYFHIHSTRLFFENIQIFVHTLFQTFAHSCTAPKNELFTLFLDIKPFFFHKQLKTSLQVTNDTTGKVRQRHLFAWFWGGNLLLIWAQYCAHILQGLSTNILLIYLLGSLVHSSSSSADCMPPFSLNGRS